MLGPSVVATCVSRRIALVINIGGGVAKASETHVAAKKLASDVSRGLREVN
jgi:hypothetical protein